VKKSNNKKVAKADRKNTANKAVPVPPANKQPVEKKTPDIPVMPESGRKSQGGISDYSEVIADSVEHVRGEFLSDWRKAKITITVTSVTFNMACVNLFPDCQHITISIDKGKHRLFIEPTKEYDDTSLKFANFKNSRNIPRTCTIKGFCSLLFNLMKWNPNAKYRILTIYQEFGEKKVMIYNLDDALEVFPEAIDATENGKKKRKTTFNMPEGWQGRFGYRNDELAEKRQLDFSNEIVTFNYKTGECQSSDIEPKPPTEEELIHEQYGGIRPRKEKSKNED
jgi:hypothetical protein